MRCLVDGHIYELGILDGKDDDDKQTLTFVQRTGLKYPGNEFSHAGTTTQEVLRALIDRSRYVNNQAPCMETEAMIGLLQSALILAELRAARKRESHLDFPTIEDFEEAPTSSVDGHVL